MNVFLEHMPFYMDVTMSFDWMKTYKWNYKKPLNSNNDLLYLWREITRVVLLDITIKDDLTKYKIVNDVHLDGNLDNDVVRFQIDGSHNFQQHLFPLYTKVKIAFI